MASILTKTNRFISSVPVSLLWPRFGIRSVCSTGFRHMSEPSAAEPDVPSPGRKVLETFTEEFEIGSRLITLETGKIARFANGAVVMGMEETRVLSTVASSKGDGVREFLPLTVCVLSSVCHFSLILENFEMGFWNSRLSCIGAGVKSYFFHINLLGFV